MAHETREKTKADLKHWELPDFTFVLFVCFVGISEFRS